MSFTDSVLVVKGNAVTVMEVAEAKLGRPATTSKDFDEAGLSMFGGGGPCGATIAAYNAHPSRSGYLKCSDCIGGDGFATTAEAVEFIFNAASLPAEWSDEEVLAEYTDEEIEELLREQRTFDKVVESLTSRLEEAESLRADVKERIHKWCENVRKEGGA